MIKIGVKWWRASQVVDLVSIFAVLIAMLVANVDWAFTQTGGVDSWMYYGFFHHYDLSDYLAGNKKIARLPWILLGFTVNKLFAPETASLVLHIGCFALGIFFFYILIRQMFGRKTAVLASLVYVTWIPLHGWGGWDYHNTLVPVLYFSAYRLLIYATTSDRAPLRRFFFFGVMYALAVHTNILVIVLLPAFLIRGAHNTRSWLAQDTSRRAWFLRSGAGTVLGAVSITAVLGFINVAFGRMFFFSGILIARSAVLVEHPVLNQSEWKSWSSLWWLRDIHTPLFDSVFVLIVVVAIFSVRRWSLNALLGSSVNCAFLEYTVCLAIFAAGQTEGQELLQPFYMMMPLALPMFIALAALIKRTISVPTAAADVGPARPLRNMVLVLFAASAFGVQFVGDLAINPRLFDWRPAAWYNMPEMLVILLGFAVAGVLTHAALPWSSDTRLFRPRTVAAYACLAVALGQSNTMWRKEAVQSDYVAFSPCAINRAILASVSATDNILFPLMRAGKQLVLWYRANEATGPSPSCQLPTLQLGRPLFAMGYGAFVNFWDFEGATAPSATILGQLVPGRDVAVLISGDDRYVSTIIQGMQHYNSAWKQTAVDTVGGYGMPFKLHLITAEPPPAQPLNYRVVPQNGAVASAAGATGMAISLPRTPWTYAATLASAKPRANDSTIVVTLEITAGTAEIGVLNRTGSAFLTREPIPSGAEPIDVYLRVPDWRVAGSIVLETGAEPGTGTAIISSVASMR